MENNEEKLIPSPEKLVQLLIGNYGKKGGKRPLGSILLEAGYSPATARNPHLILQTKQVRDQIEPFLKKLERKRDRVLDALSDKKIDKEKASQLAYILDVLTKNYELLSGRPTERIDNLTDEQKKELSALLKHVYEK